MKDTKIEIKGIPEGYTERTHSGNSATWQPKGASWHDETKKFRLDAPIKGLKAEFIEGKWYWVCGCSKCLGTNEKYCYWVCEKHDVCQSCGTYRKDLKDIPWGCSDGWVCKPCRDKEDWEEKIDRLTKFESNELDAWDFDDLDEARCPHCNTAYNDIFEDAKMICDCCGGEFEIEVRAIPKYTMRIIGARVTLKSVLAQGAKAI